MRRDRQESGGARPLGGACGVVDSPVGGIIAPIISGQEGRNGMEKKAGTHRGGLMPAGLDLVALQ